MARALLFLLLTLTLPACSGHVASAQPTPATRQLEAGNRHYAEGAYRAALEAYDAILASGYESAALYANMGSAHFKLGRHGQAIRYFEKARRLQPGDERLRHNLQLARQRAGLDAGAGARAGGPWWAAAGRALGTWLPPPAWAALGLLLYLIGCAVAGDGLRRHPRWPHVRRAALACAALGLLVVGLGLWASAAQTTGRQAVVVEPRPTLRAAPAPAADALRTLPEGLMLDVQQRQAPWARVRLADGTTGWLRLAEIGAI